MEATLQPGPSLNLNDIQGNVAGFNKDHQRVVFLRFADRDSGRRFVGVCTQREGARGGV